MTKAQGKQIAGLVVALGILGNLGTVAADLTPEAELKSRGLSLSKNVYVLEAEAEFLEKVEEARPLYAHVEILRTNLVVITNHEREFDQLQTQRAALEDDLRKLRAGMKLIPRFGYRLNGTSADRDLLHQAQFQESQLEVQLSECDRILRLASKSLVPPGEKGKLLNEYQAARGEFLATAREMRPLGDEILKQYEELAKDSKVKNALNTLMRSARTKLVLGPSPEFNKGMSQLKVVEKAWSPEGESIAPKQNRLPKRRTHR